MSILEDRKYYEQYFRLKPDAVYDMAQTSLDRIRFDLLTKKNETAQENLIILFIMMSNFNYLFKKEKYGYNDLCEKYQNYISETPEVKIFELDIIFSFSSDESLQTLSYRNNFEKILYFYWMLNYVGILFLDMDPIEALSILENTDWNFSDPKYNDTDFNSGFGASKIVNYGNRDIFNVFSRKAIPLGVELINTYQKNAFEKLIVVFGFNRFLCDIYQNKENVEEKINSFKFDDFKDLIIENSGLMGQIRRLDIKRDTLMTPLTDNRLINAIKMVENFYDEGYTGAADVVYFEDSKIIEFTESYQNSIILDKIIVKFLTLTPEKNILSSLFEINPKNLDDDQHCTNSQGKEKLNECGLYFDTELKEEELQNLFESFGKCLSFGNPDDIKKFHQDMALKVIHMRGGGTVAEWFAITLFEVFGFDFKGWSQNPLDESWSLAITSLPEDFILEYPAIF